MVSLRRTTTVKSKSPPMKNIKDIVCAFPSAILLMN
jgi:hypothetical protein